MERACLAVVMAAAMLGCVTGAPNIVWFVADDAGYYDFGSNNPNITTGNISRLKEEGLFLNQSYVLPMCTPTRSAFLTGRYPHTFGTQDNSLDSGDVFWVNETFTMLPRELKKLNYTTHMMGKWHLGSCHPALTPMGQGFDTYYGMWYGAHQSYYTHRKGNTYDWWDGWNIDLTAEGHYKTELIAQRAVKIINESNSNQPFFMFLSFASPHGPKQVPQSYIDTFCSSVTPDARQKHCGMMAALDSAVGRVITALKDKGIYEDSLILFTSDNGGAVNTGGLNYPLRGEKKTVFEGGIRSYTIVKAKDMAATNTTYPGLVYAVDWYPTLVKAAGGNVPSDIHGKDMFEVLKNNTDSPRKSFLHVDDYVKFNYTVVRYKQWKLIRAMPGLQSGSKWQPGFKKGWYPADKDDWEDVRGQYTQEEAFLFNINEDPFERNNTYDLVKDLPIFDEIEAVITEYLGPNGAYPLQPFQYPEVKTKNNRKNGYPSSCWCDPPGLSDSPLCPFNVTTIG